jgi:hypothetical protein
MTSTKQPTYFWNVSYLFERFTEAWLMKSNTRIVGSRNVCWSTVPCSICAWDSVENGSWEAYSLACEHTKLSKTSGVQTLEYRRNILYLSLRRGCPELSYNLGIGESRESSGGLYDTADYTRYVGKWSLVERMTCPKCVLNTQIRTQITDRNLVSAPSCRLSYKKCKGKGKAVPLQTWTGLEGSRRLRLQDFKTIGTWTW